MLEKIIADKSDPARELLIWENGFFLQKARKTVKQKEIICAVNSPLTLQPEYVDELKKYIKISKSEQNAFRAANARRKKLT